MRGRIDGPLAMVLCVASLLILVIASVTIYFIYRENINLVGKEKFEHKAFYSPDRRKKITLLLYTTGEFHHYIYVIDGIYSYDEVPKDNYIKFPDGSGIIVEWVSNDVCKIVSDSLPEKNIIKPCGYKITVILDDKKIRILSKKGRVIYNSLNFYGEEINENP